MTAGRRQRSSNDVSTRPGDSLADQRRRRTAPSTRSATEGMTGNALLDSPLPALTDLTERPSVALPDAGVPALQTVREWTALPWQVHAHYRHVQQALHQRGNCFRPMRNDDQSVDGIYRPGDTRDLQIYFQQTAGSALNSLFQWRVIASSWKQSGLAIEVGLEPPDIVTRLVRTDALPSDVLSTSTRRRTLNGHGRDRALVLGLVKQRDFCPTGNLVRRYSTDTHVQHAVEQLANLLTHFGCKVGFITTYHLTWAVHCDTSGILQLSRPFRATDSMHESTLAMLHHIISAARDDPDQPSRPQDVDEQADTEGGRSTTVSRRRAQPDAAMCQEPRASRRRVECEARP